MESVYNTIERIKTWWCPEKKPEEVHLLDPREVVHDKPPTLNDLTKIIYFYKTPKLKK